MTAPPKTRVLVIDDEPQILRALRINLSVRGYQVSTAATGHDGLRAAAERKPDVVVLDLGLPDMPGIEVLEGLRGWLTAPVIVLSARSDSADKVEALDAGADEIEVEFGAGGREVGAPAVHLGQHAGVHVRSHTRVVGRRSPSGATRSSSSAGECRSMWPIRPWYTE